MQVNKMSDIIVKLLLFIAICMLLSTVCVRISELPAGETIGQWVWFGKAILISSVCIVAACLILLFKKKSKKSILSFPGFSDYVSWGLIFLGAVEAIWGLRQLYGFSVSGHPYYALTGSFFNPGPYAGYLVIVLPICLHQYLHIRKEWRRLDWPLKIEKLLAAIVGLLILCVLPATMSRSAWLAATIACVWVIYMNDKKKWRLLWQRYKKKYFIWGIVLFCGLSAMLVALFFLKQDSALGRLFIWKMICQAIAIYPLGCSKGFFYAYNEAQDNYFYQGNYAAWEERVAGSPEYAFNEYLELSAVKGIHVCITLLIFIAVSWWLGRKLGRYGICGAIMSLMVFAFSSYPMHIPAFVVAFVSLILACSIGDIIGKPLIVFVCLLLFIGDYDGKWREEEGACMKWTNARVYYQVGDYQTASEAYKKLYPRLCKNGVFLFEYGHSLHKSGFYNESNKYLKEACLYSTDPMVLNIIGKNYQELHRYEQAETLFLRSVHRLPGRIYPYYLLANLYAEPEFYQPDKLKEVADIVLTKEPKVHSTAIEEMRKEIKKIVNELE